MANRTEANPWCIDTASATPITTDKIRIAKIVWDAEGASAGSNAIITHNRPGKGVFWARTASGANFTGESDTFRGVSGDCFGVIVPTLDAGTLYIYYD